MRTIAGVPAPPTAPVAKDAILPAPSKRQLRGLIEALAAVEDADADLRFVSALTGLLTASSGRIPHQLANDLVEYNGQGRPEALLTVYEASAWVFDEACGRSAKEFFVEFPSGSEHDEVARRVWSECRFGRYSLLPGEAEFVDNSKVTGPEPMVAYFLLAFLEAHGGAHPMERELLLHVALGIPPEARLSDEMRSFLSGR